MSSNGKPVTGKDIPIVKLVPRKDGKATAKQRKRIEASLRAVGLIEPLIVYPQGDNYEILDGCIRYNIFLDMGIESLPCIIWHEREAFTANRMVKASGAKMTRLWRTRQENTLIAGKTPCSRREYRSPVTTNTGRKNWCCLNSRYWINRERLRQVPRLAIADCD